MTEVSRRDFLKGSAAAGGIVLAAPWWMSLAGKARLPLPVMRFYSDGLEVGRAPVQRVAKGIYQAVWNTPITTVVDAVRVGLRPPKPLNFRNASPVHLCCGDTLKVTYSVDDL